MAQRACLFLLGVIACDSPEDDACAAGAPVLTLGVGVGSDFEPLEDGTHVGVSTAPQGGFGVPVGVRTRGFEIGTETLVEVDVTTELDGASIGQYRIGGVALLCESHAVGGTIPGVIVGFDPAVYPTQQELVGLNGRIVTLKVTVDAPDGTSASEAAGVIVDVGG